MSERNECCGLPDVCLFVGCPEGAEMTPQELAHWHMVAALAEIAKDGCQNFAEGDCQSNLLGPEDDVCHACIAKSGLVAADQWERHAETENVWRGDTEHGCQIDPADDDNNFADWALWLERTVATIELQSNAHTRHLVTDAHARALVRRIKASQR